ncbi:MAG: hypothetical protein OXJ55_00945 [Caldilineaceae bacterium]|nr:hypothetical protein [Caldilineaceae bacterium]MDE0461510.1 hypothetical protein [Caldilineaceae bacterium]
MCIILDANCFGSYRDRSNKDLQPIRNWLAKQNGKIAYSDTGKFQSEWRRGGLDYREMNRAGQLKLIPKEKVLKTEAQLVDGLESDDAHVIALALEAKIGVLVVQRQPDEPLRGKKRRARGADTALQRDFQRLAQGKVYITKSHKNLLKRDTCP